MKRIYYMLIVALSATVLMAGGIDKVVAKLSNVSTTSVATVSTTSKITGYINRADLSFATSTVPSSIIITASNAYTGLVTPILTTIASTNVSYQYTNNAQRLTVLDEYIRVSCTNAISTNQDIMVTIIYERP